MTPNRVSLRPIGDRLVGRQVGRAEFLPAVAVDLQIDPARREPGQIAIGRIAAGQAGDSLAGDLDFDRLRRWHNDDRRFSWPQR